MGWFWADNNVSAVTAGTSPHPLPHNGSLSQTPPPGCPMHDSATVKPPTPAVESACPYTPPEQSLKADAPKAPSKFAKYNPLNYMFSDISQDRAVEQTYALSTEREPSTIPKGSGGGNWEYPSPQQMYNALLRKGYSDTDITAVTSMVDVHNFLNEGAWAEIVEWERRFGGGLIRGWEMCKRGEQGSMAGANLDVGANEGLVTQPKLVRFMGRPKDMTPKAAMIQVLGWIYPSAFGTEAPFDRHDWFVEREYKGQRKEVRYVIDYYSGPPEPTGEPVFYLDVRPALTPTAAVERMMRWGGDVWYRGSGAAVREAAA